jgi:hypothetical protein
MGVNGVRVAVDGLKVVERGGGGVIGERRGGDGVCGGVRGVEGVRGV